jgi:putative PIN family toxin of toxin-antitoxin system
VTNSTIVRVVLDTNVLLSACWSPTGLEARLVSLSISGQLTACVSTAVLAEYRDVLSRPKFIGMRVIADETLNSFESAATVVQPTTTLRVSPDDDDNRFLECAAAAQADYLISGNLRHYPASLGTIQIVNARRFFELNSIR